MQPARASALRRHAFILLGAAAWCALELALRPSPFEADWARLLLLLSVLVLVPLGVRLGLPCSQRIEVLLLVAGLALAVAQVLPQGRLAGVLSLPWALVTGLLALRAARRCVGRRVLPLHAACADAAFLFLPVGAGWALLDRLGVQPLDFHPIIVLLTAIHFHHAGFTLPLVTSRVVRGHAGLLGRLTCAGVIVGVPLVAIGITATRLGAAPWLETLAALVLAAAGLALAFALARRALRGGHGGLVRALWGSASVSLAAGMLLAALYACRSLLPLAWLDIPWMRATHGTANALGFGLLSLLAWAGEARPRTGSIGPP